MAPRSMLRELVSQTRLPRTSKHQMIDYVARANRIDRFDAIHKTRDWVASLKSKSRRLLSEAMEPLPPRYPIEDVLSLVNPDIRKAFDMKEVVLRLVDDSRLSIFKPKYGPNMLTAWAHIMGKSMSTAPGSIHFTLTLVGFPVGIVANQISVINPNEAAKAAQFIRLCNQE